MNQLTQHIDLFAQLLQQKGYDGMMNVYPAHPSMAGSASSDLKQALSTCCQSFQEAKLPLPDHWYINILLDPPVTGWKGRVPDAAAPREYLDCELKVRYDEAKGFIVDRTVVSLRREPQELLRVTGEEMAQPPSKKEVLKIYPRQRSHRLRNTRPNGL